MTSVPPVERIVAERVRVVEGERDALRIDLATCERIANGIEDRAESAEAAHRALRAIAEDIAYQHAATIDGEYGCCHDEDALRAGGRVPEFDGDEFEPIPDDCPGKQTLDRHLDRIAASGGAR